MKKSILIGIAMFLSLGQAADAKEGSMYILTTPDGANLPAGASVEGFPLLVRLDKDFFDFSSAQAKGQDIRFATPGGAALPYQIEQWDAKKGTASIWVRIPKITGNARQEIKVRWATPQPNVNPTARRCSTSPTGTWPSGT